MATRSRIHTISAFLSCAATVVVLLARRQLPLRQEHVGHWLTFADGTRSRVYRETVRRGADTAEPALLVVQFRLRLVGRSRVLHALFRIESLANTLLFAGFAGFRSKLWLTDEQTGIYRGVYQWDGADLAVDYASTLCALLRLVCVPGSVRFHVEPGTGRDAYLADPDVLADRWLDGSETWWQLDHRELNWSRAAGCRDRRTSPPGEPAGTGR